MQHILTRALGGWDPSSTSPDQAFTKVEHEIKDEIDQAFRNVELNLKSAGGKGWTQVFRVNSYHTDLTPEVLGRMTENFGKWMPDHKPVWTAVGVTKLGVDGMHVEIEVSAHDPEGSK